MEELQRNKSSKISKVNEMFAQMVVICQKIEYNLL